MSKRESKLFENKPKSVDIDLDISAIKRKRVRINHDDSKILELNVSDMNITSRLRTAYEELTKLMDDVAKTVSIPEDTENLTEEDSEKITNALSEIDKRMREQIDYIFDAPVSEACSDGGSMWDPFEGSFRYEYIIDKIAGLYNENLTAEFSKMRSRVDNKLQDHKKAVSKYHR